MIAENKSNNLFKNLQNIIFTNYKVIIVVLLIALISFIGFQINNYFKIQKIKKTSISFFEIINNNQDNLIDLEKLINDNNIYSILSKLKLIQKNNEMKNFNYSNKLYKELLSSSNLDTIYKSSIAANASYTMINASYEESTNYYINDILNYIKYINDEMDGYFSIKKELEYLIIVTEIDLNQLEYKNNSKAMDKYNEIFNSSLVSASVKERVKKIHELQLYN